MDIKICGLRLRDEVEAVESAGVTYAGLWTGIEGHANNLSDGAFMELSSLFTRVTPVAVCIGRPFERVIDLTMRSLVGHVQLHGFNTPSDIELMKARGLTVIKTLHITPDGFCPEERWLDAYIKAGADIFLLDRFEGTQQIGSTGRSLDDDIVSAWCNRLAGQRIWLAGGLNAARLGALAGSGAVETADIDSAARRHGQIHPRAVRDLVTAARSGAPVPMRRFA